jgi:hypothetical protein
MAIVCPRCGKQFDVTLFQFGKQVRCSCGEKVAIPLDREPLSEPRPRSGGSLLTRIFAWLRAKKE